MIRVRADRERKTANFIENTMPGGLSADKILPQVLADSDSEKEYLPSYDVFSRPVNASLLVRKDFSFF